MFFQKHSTENNDLTQQSDFLEASAARTFSKAKS